jgi:hypothetical protein
MIILRWDDAELVFEGMSLPDSLTGGGDQTLVTHKLIGGKRIVDAMGPDDEPIAWQGFLLDEFAQLQVFQLDLLRRSGREVQLLLPIPQRAYRAVVGRFTWTQKRPYLYDYSISLTIIEDQVAGDGAAASRSLEQEIAADLDAAETYAAARDDVLAIIAIASTVIRAATGDRGALRGLGSLALAEAQGAVGEAVFASTGQAAAANAAVAAVGGVGGVLLGGDPKAMALNFLGTVVSVEAASSMGLASAHMTNVQTSIAEAPA